MCAEPINLAVNREKLVDYQEKRYLLQGLCFFGVGLIVVWLLLPLSSWAMFPDVCSELPVRAEDFCSLWF